MVSHTGHMEATIKAINTVDGCLGIISKKIIAEGGAMIITADHGNAEIMLSPTGDIDTEHNPSPIPCIIVSKELQGNHATLEEGILADVAPTILRMLNIPKPSQMTGRDILSRL